MTRRAHDLRIKHVANERYILTCADCGRVYAAGSEEKVAKARSLLIHADQAYQQKKRGLSRRMRTARRARRKAAA